VIVVKFSAQRGLKKKCNIPALLENWMVAKPFCWAVVPRPDNN
jgi:hypothetical protein